MKYEAWRISTGSSRVVFGLDDDELLRYIVIFDPLSHNFLYT